MVSDVDKKKKKFDLPNPSTRQPLNAVCGRIFTALNVDPQLGRELKSSLRRYDNRMTAPSNRQVRLRCAALTLTASG